MENHQEDILKKMLQDTFSDYEPEPSETSWSTIFSAIQPNQLTFWGKFKPYIASILVILTGIWLWYGSSKVEVNNVEIAFNDNEPIRAIAMSDKKQSDDSQTGKIQQQSDDSQTEKISKLAKIQTVISNQSDDSQAIQVVKNQSITSLKNIQEKEKQSEIIKYSKEIIVKNNAPKEERENHPTVEKQSDEVVISTSIDTQGSGRVETLAMDVAMNKMQSDGSQTGKAYQFENKDVISNLNSGRVGKIVTDIENTSIFEQVRYIHPMESLRNKDFTLTKIFLNLPVITPIITPNRKAKPVRQHTYLNMSITPIQTYRILTINNNNVQNVQTSKLFDSERNGWQFDVGMIKPISKMWNFRANFSYLRMRQWSEYQVGTNELILRNTNYGSNNSNSAQGASNTLEIVGQNITESKNLHMVGLKMDVQKFFKITGKNRYFISTGTQFMYENTQKQSNLFLNVSTGFQHIISPTTFLTIEPIASYSLNNFNDSKSLLQANGYNLGLKIGVSFKVK